MSYRKIKVNEKEYRYTIGRQFTKILDVGLFQNHEYGQPTDRDLFIVTPYHVRTMILGKPAPKIFTCRHGTVTQKLTYDPFDSEIYGKHTLVMKCKECQYDSWMNT